ncbi:MAG: alpha/beta fold hydrolase [Alphaproteobacteria bacterium]|nr:MAG: alpha/beta fold hydrolase [Alphaproteobacteria bacterium]
MMRFLLVHGSAHGAWCWRALTAALADLGHRAEALDLPGRGDDPEALAAVTLEDDARAILARLETPAIVVGHSAAGFAITQAAEIDPAHILRLVYLCAYVPRPGMSLAMMRRAWPEQPLAGRLVMAPGGAAYRFAPEAIAENLYADCPPEAAADAAGRLVWQAVRPQSEPLRETGRVRMVPRSYIRCAADRTIPPEYQAQMSAGFGPEDVYTLPYGHSPFLAAPERLAKMLDEIVRNGESR